MAITASITRREARLAVDTFVHNYLANTSDSVTPETIVSMQQGVSKDIQIRDYLLGLTLEYPLPKVIEALSVMSEFIPEGSRAGIYSVLAAHNYQNEDESRAQEFLALALNEDESYSLAKLLQRVINAGWPVGAFHSMTMELHPKVVAGLDDTIIE
jgi:hypothetical protein